jgi:hypothetical protein
LAIRNFRSFRARNFITGQVLVVDGGGLIGGGEPLM